MKLTPTITLPADTACRTLAVIAQKGSGKTYTGMKITELLWSSGSQIAAIDPTGVWWGLRAAGKGAALDFTIMGGEHGDVPLEPTAGELVAEFINNTGRSVVMDLSQFESKAAQNKFLTAFATKLFFLKASNRTPLHIMMDEADQFAPQKPMPGEQAMLGAFERIVRLGRSRGLGMTMITQRAAVLNKNLLTQVDALICHRIVGKQDLDAVADWMKYYSPDPTSVNQCLKSLPQQEQGHMWLWSPSWLKVFANSKVLPRQTYDSSSTPDSSVALPRVKMLPVDLGALTAQIRATMEKAVANDPKTLRKRIQELEKELAALKAKPATPPPAVLSKQDLEVIKQLTGLEMARIVPILQTLEQATAPQRGVVYPRPTPEEARRIAPANSKHDKEGTGYLPPPKITKSVGDLVIKPAQQRILDALAFYECIGIRSPSPMQVGAVAALDASGGHFSNTIGPLSSAGLLDRQNGTITLTGEGRLCANLPPHLDTLDQYHDMLRQRVRKIASNKTVEMMDAIIRSTEGANKSTTAEVVGHLVSIDHTGGHFSNTIGPLSTLGLIRRSQGQIFSTDILFPNLP